ncbi:MAG: twin-arginine translocase TatA/TatE family subunit [Myxococcota bacterium]
MLNIGAGELLVVVVVGLLVLRPEDLPALMRKLGAAVSFLRQQTVALQRMLMNPCDDETDSDGSIADSEQQQPLAISEPKDACTTHEN